MNPLSPHSRLLLAGLLALSLVLTACGGTSGTHSGGSGGAAGQFGVGPHPDPAITYQPDVVMIPAGPAAIRGVSNDGLSWTLDPNAQGVHDLAVGKILYASNYAVGRVIDLQNTSDGTVVALAPVGLGDVIKNGNMTVSQPVDLANWSMPYVPSTPGGIPAADAASSPSPSATDSSSDSPSPQANSDQTSSSPDPASPSPDATDSSTASPTDGSTPPISFHAQGSAAENAAWTHSNLPALPQISLPSMPPPFTQGDTGNVAMGAWTGRITRDSGTVLVHLVHQGDMTAGVDLTFHFATPHLDADLGIRDGQVGDGKLELRGLREVSIKVTAGSVSGLSSNLKQTMDIPITMSTPIIAFGVAMTLKVSWKFLLETAFSAKNSTITAEGDWTTDGPLSVNMASGQVTASMPTINTKVSPLDSIQSTSVGVTGIVFGANMKIGVGLGLPGFNAGIWAKIIVTDGVATGSDLGIIKCLQSTLNVVGSGGVGLDLNSTATSALNAYFAALKSPLKIPDEPDKSVISQKLYTKSFYTPQKDMCKV